MVLINLESATQRKQKEEKTSELLISSQKKQEEARKKPNICQRRPEENRNHLANAGPGNNRGDIR
jgi:hypothetical protein